MADVNVGLLLSTTLKNYRKKLVDNIHKSSAIFYYLKENGGFKTESGGERIVQPLMYGKNTTASSYSGYEQLDTTPQEGIDSAEYNWKQYSVSITISGEEEEKRWFFKNHRHSRSQNQTGRNVFNRTAHNWDFLRWNWKRLKRPYRLEGNGER